MTESIDVKVSLLVSKVQDLYSSYGWAPDKEFDEILTDAYRLADDIEENLSPISVSDYLPDWHHRNKYDECWLWRTDGVEEFWELSILPHNVEEYNKSSINKYTHWLPYYALPLPPENKDD